jgi:hypothetical protein
MKNILESPEVFEAYAQIDLMYFGLRNILKKIEFPRSPLEIMVDDATGFQKSQTTKNIKDSIEIIENIIRCKKTIEAPIDSDEKLLNQLKNLK